MKAALLREYDRPLEIEDIAIDLPGPREIVVRTMASGLCHSDLNIMQGKVMSPKILPMVLGHESAGVVEKIGSEVRHLRPGDHVVACVSGYCGNCAPCLTGHMAICDAPDNLRAAGATSRLFDRQGDVSQFFGVSGFAEQMLIHERNCVKIRRDMPFDKAAVIGCAVTTGVGAVFHAAKVEPGSTVAVLGCGGVGLSAVNGAALAGASRIVAIDRLPLKLDLARKMGATDVVNASEVDSVAAVRELCDGGVHHSFEAVGLKSTIFDAVKMLRRGGMATIIGVLAPGVNAEISAMDLIGSKGLRGTMMGDNIFPIDIPRLVDFYLQGRLHLDELVSGTIALSDINAGFDDMQAGSVARTVIMF